MDITASATDRTKEQQLHLGETSRPRASMIDGEVRRKRARRRGAAKVKGKQNKNKKEEQEQKKKKRDKDLTGLTGRRRAHLSDGCAELALEDLLQRLELVARDVARLLQLLQQLYRPGNIWQGGGEKHMRNVCKGKGGLRRTTSNCSNGARRSESMGRFQRKWILGSGAVWPRTSAL